MVKNAASVIMRLLLSLALAAPSVAGCAGPESLALEDRREIYAAVIRRVYLQDDTFGGALRPPTLYILEHSDDSVGDPEGLRSVPQVFEEPLRQALESSLGDLPTSLVWVGSIDEVPRDPQTHSIAEGGAVLTLGNIHPTGKDEVQVSASLYVGMLAAGGQTYILERQNGSWILTGTTGVTWIS